MSLWKADRSSAPSASTNPALSLAASEDLSSWHMKTRAQDFGANILSGKEMESHVHLGAQTWRRIKCCKWRIITMPQMAAPPVTCMWHACLSENCTGSLDQDDY